jgi:hypothetical protein
MLKKFKTHVILSILDFLCRFNLIKETTIYGIAVMKVQVIYNNEGSFGVMKCILDTMLFGNDIFKYRFIKMPLCLYMTQYLETYYSKD